LYHNTGPQIREAVAQLQERLNDAGVPLTLFVGADNHIVPEFVDGLKRGHLLALGDYSYVLVEPPHHVAPARFEDLLFNILVAGYVPILTHPERLSWIESKYDVIQRLAHRGVWMQIPYVADSEDDPVIGLSACWKRGSSTSLPRMLII
jgi:protein-tyrosine phosphatase